VWKRLRADLRAADYDELDGALRPGHFPATRSHGCSRRNSSSARRDRG
jgi:hypothetical protein